MTISGLSDTGVSPGRRFQPLILGLAVAIWALTHFTGHDSRDPSGLTLAHQPGHSSASGWTLKLSHRKATAGMSQRPLRYSLSLYESPQGKDRANFRLADVQGEG